MNDWLSSAMGSAAGRFGPVILMYHSIENSLNAPAWEWSVSLKRFREQVDYLASHGWTFGKLGELDFRAPQSSKQIVITFDDAYSDTLAAADVLVAANIQASWFVVANALSGQSSWDDEGIGRRETLRPNQLRDLLRCGMQIGAHSMSHRRLALINPDELGEEILGCKRMIENSIGAGLTSFSYPYGSYSDAVVAAVDRASFRNACTTRNGATFTDESNLLLRRVAIKANDTLSEFKRKLLLLNDDVDLRGSIRSVLRLSRSAVSRIVEV